MEKVIVIGCPGAGKSTFSRELNKITGLPLYHLDLLNWNSDKTTVGKEVFYDRLQNILILDKWIIDGNYLSSLELRIRECDTVFFLDYSSDVCINGIMERKGKPRADMPWIETEDDEEFLQFVRDFSFNTRPSVIELITKYNEKNIIVFNNRAQADKYIMRIKSRYI